MTPTPPCVACHADEEQLAERLGVACRAAFNPFALSRVRPGCLSFRFSTDADRDALVLRALLERLRQQNWWGQIVGPHGVGKSTLLRTLLPALAAAGRSVELFSFSGDAAARAANWRRLRNVRLPTGSAAQIVIDGYEQLSWWRRRQLRRRCARQGVGLLVTCHRDLGLPLLHRVDRDLATLQSVVRDLLPPGCACVSPDDVAACFAAQGGNPRETLFALYDLYELRRPK